MVLDGRMAATPTTAMMNTATIIKMARISPVDLRKLTQLHVKNDDDRGNLQNEGKKRARTPGRRSRALDGLSI
jgi:hypothetical protein